LDPDDSIQGRNLLVAAFFIDPGGSAKAQDIFAGA
jgi:hypothetical protein